MHTHPLAGLAAVAALGLVTLSIAPSAQADNITPIAYFTGIGSGTNGSEPRAELTSDSLGNLYGTTAYGGANGDGTVFEIAAGTSTLTTIASFGPSVYNGLTPYGGVTIDSSGNLFGTTLGGGSGPYHDTGVVWEIAHGTNTIVALASFLGTSAKGDPNWANPQAGVTLDSSGNLFGTTFYGGTANVGTVWELAHGSTTITTLASFTDFPNGAYPAAGVTLDSIGNLWGTTLEGGSNGSGLVYEIAHGSTTLTTVASFTGTNGGGPAAEVTFDDSGNLFGTTGNGGANGLGTVWEIAQGSTAITTLASFASAPGGNAASVPPPSPDHSRSRVRARKHKKHSPLSGTAAGGIRPQVTAPADEDLFGTTIDLGSTSNGTVWEIAAGSATITTLAEFTGANGSSPYAGVTFDSSGNLFGTTVNGGPGPDFGGDGTVYEIPGASTPDSHTQMLWNKTDGTASLWNVLPSGTYASVQYGPFPGWTAKAPAAAPDGTNWLLWTNTNGTAALWHVTALTATGYTATQYGPYAGYSAVSLSVGGDGSPHLLWDKIDGTALLWTVNPANGSFTYTSYGPFSGWTANAVASGATVTDLLWTNTNGTADGYRIASGGTLTSHAFGPYNGYTAKSLSVGPDDGAHLLWDKTDGTALLWNVDFSTGAFTYTSYGPFSGYAARAIATGPDDVTHILWDATNGTASLWAVTGSGYTYHAYGPFAGWTAVGVSAGL